MHQLTLTDTELRDLALLGYLGNQLANGRIAPGHDKPYPELHQALQKIYGLAYDAGLPSLRVSEDSTGELGCMQHESTGLDPEAQRVHDLIDDYEEQAAFEIAAEELANRDDHAYMHTPAGQQAGEQQRKALNDQAYERYMDEFEQHGFERLGIDRRCQKLPCQSDAPQSADAPHKKPQQ